MSSLLSVLMAWDLTSFLNNATSQLKTWGGLFIILIGVVMIIVGAYQVAKGFIAHGKAQTNWFIAIGLIIVGGALAVGGWAFVFNIASGGKKTITDLGETGTIIMSNLTRFLP